MKIKARKDLLKIILGVLCVILLVVGVALILNAWEDNHYTNDNSLSSANSNDSTGDIEYNGTWYKLNKNIDTVLLVGVDKYLASTDSDTYINSQQSDFLMLMIIDTESESYRVLHINRDIMTDVNMLGVTGDVIGTVYEQIALAHTYGSGEEDSAENTVDAVSNLLYGVDVDHYITITMDAVSIINDAVGGVTVTALDTINDDIVEGETVTLLGENALLYVRTRMGLEDSTNLHRMERQKQYLEALFEQFNKKLDEDSSFFLSVALDISQYMVSDCSVNELSSLFNTMSDYELIDYLTIEGESILGEEFIECYVDEDALYELYLELFYVPIED